jgi:hypothetical protein
MCGFTNISPTLSGSRQEQGFGPMFFFEGGISRIFVGADSPVIGGKRAEG